MEKGGGRRESPGRRCVLPAVRSRDKLNRHGHGESGICQQASSGAPCSDASAALVPCLSSVDQADFLAGSRKLPQLSISRSGAFLRKSAEGHGTAVGTSVPRHPPLALSPEIVGDQADAGKGQLMNSCRHKPSPTPLSPLPLCLRRGFSSPPFFQIQTADATVAWRMFLQRQQRRFPEDTTECDSPTRQSTASPVQSRVASWCYGTPVSSAGASPRMAASAPCPFPSDKGYSSAQRGVGLFRALGARDSLHAGRGFSSPSRPGSRQPRTVPTEYHLKRIRGEAWGFLCSSPRSALYSLTPFSKAAQPLAAERTATCYVGSGDSGDSDRNPFVYRPTTVSSGARRRRRRKASLLVCPLPPPPAVLAKSVEPWQHRPSWFIHTHPHFRQSRLQRLALLLLRVRTQIMLPLRALRRALQARGATCCISVSSATGSRRHHASRPGQPVNSKKSGSAVRRGTVGTGSRRGSVSSISSMSREDKHARVSSRVAKSVKRQLLSHHRRWDSPDSSASLDAVDSVADKLAGPGVMPAALQDMEEGAAEESRIHYELSDKVDSRSPTLWPSAPSEGTTHSEQALSANAEDLPSSVGKSRSRLLSLVALFPIVFLLNVAVAFIAPKSALFSLTAALLRLHRRTRRFSSRAYESLKFCFLVVTMYPFVHGCYLPGLAAIWIIARIREGCWWLYVNRCLGYRTSEQLHQEKMRRLRQLWSRSQSATAGTSPTFSPRALARLMQQRAGLARSQQWLNSIQPVSRILVVVSTVLALGLRLLLLPARPCLLALASLLSWKHSAGLGVGRLLRCCAGAVLKAAELVLSVAAATTALTATDAQLVKEVDKVTAAEAVAAALPEGSVYTAARARAMTVQAVARPEDMVSRLWRVGDGRWNSWPWSSTLTATGGAPVSVKPDQKTGAVDQRSDNPESRPRRAEVFEVLTGQELMMFSQPLMIVSGVGYTDHLTLPDLVEVVETQLLGKKASESAQFPMLYEDGSPDPLTAFKHPRLRTVVGKLFGRYCWIRAEEFDVHNHVFKLNKHEVLSLLRHHRQKLHRWHQEGLLRTGEKEQTRDDYESVTFCSGSESGEDLCGGAPCTGGDDCRCIITCAEAQALENALASQALQPSVPLWQFVLLEHVELPRLDEECRADGEPFSSECLRKDSAVAEAAVGSMVMFRIHHAIADGIAITNMFLSDLLSGPCRSSAVDTKCTGQDRADAATSAVPVAELASHQTTYKGSDGDFSASSTSMHQFADEQQVASTLQLPCRPEEASVDPGERGIGDVAAKQGCVPEPSVPPGEALGKFPKNPVPGLERHACRLTPDEGKRIKSLVPPVSRPTSVLSRLFMQFVSYLHVPLTVASLLMLAEEKSWDCPEKPRPQRSGRICVLPPIRFRLQHLKHLRRALATVPSHCQGNLRHRSGTLGTLCWSSRWRWWRHGLRGMSLRDLYSVCAESIHSALGKSSPRCDQLVSRGAHEVRATSALGTPDKKLGDGGNGRSTGSDTELPKSALFTINELLAACLVGGISRYVQKKVAAKYAQAGTIGAEVTTASALDGEPFRTVPLHEGKAENSAVKDQDPAGRLDLKGQGPGTAFANTTQEVLRYSESMGSLSNYSSSTCSTTTSSKSSGSAWSDGLSAGLAGLWSGQLAMRSPTSSRSRERSAALTPSARCKIGRSHSGEARGSLSASHESNEPTSPAEAPPGVLTGSGDCVCNPSRGDFLCERAGLPCRAGPNPVQLALNATAASDQTSHEEHVAPGARRGSQMAQMELDMLEQLIPQLNIVVPVNLRTTEEQSFELRNNFTSSVVQVAARDAFKARSAYERLVGVRRSLRRSVRSLGALVFAFMERVSFCTTPDFLLFLQIWLTKKVSVLFSNVPGPSELPLIHGRRVHAMHFIGPLAGRIGLIVSAFSYADHLDLVITADAGILESPELLRQCMLEEYHELKRMCPPMVAS